MKFGIGTDHPGVEWSPRTPRTIIDRSMGGPDGFDDWDPLVTTGVVPPHITRNVAAVFTGGFKRAHSAFQNGTLANINNASHYGVIEHGVVFSRMNPGLASVVIDRDGKIDLKTWTDSDTANLHKVAFARQNGVPIIDFESGSDVGKPGSEVNNSKTGNWSASVDNRSRTVRSGLCSQMSNGKRYLIYGFFSSVTPNAMARVFQACSCEYAMHLDMNALEHTYFSVFSTDPRQSLRHLVTGMEAVDGRAGNNILPRFTGVPDNRDFFYIWRRSNTQ